MTEVGVASKVITAGNRIIGEIEGNTIILNAGWCRLAGIGIRIDGDASDRRRVVFERLVSVHGNEVDRPDSDQPTIPGTTPTDTTATEPKDPWATDPAGDVEEPPKGVEEDGRPSRRGVMAPMGDTE